jgi:polysaccharide biosynthesis protein PslG
LIAALAAAVAAAPAPAAPAPRGYIGINTSTPLTAESYEEMADAHVGMLRTGWILDIAKQHQGDPYDWSSFDANVEGTAGNGIDMIPVLYGIPHWISTDRGATPIGKAEKEWKKYLTAVVERYGRHGEFWDLHPEIPYRPITVWQIWNEPNSRTWWRPKPDPKAYGKLLALSARTIHRADRKAKIMTAGIVAHPTNAAAIEGNRYLRGLFKSKAARRTTDLVGFHPYAPTSREVEAQLRSARRVLKKSHMGKTPIWVTEIGWGSVGPKSHPLIMSEPKLEKEFAKVLRMAVDRRRKLKLGSFLWYHWQEHPDDICLWCESSGLIDYAGAAKPLLGIFRSIARL